MPGAGHLGQRIVGEVLGLLLLYRFAHVNPVYGVGELFQLGTGKLDSGIIAFCRWKYGGKAFHGYIQINLGSLRISKGTYASYAVAGEGFHVFSGQHSGFYAEKMLKFTVVNFLVPGCNHQYGMGSVLAVKGQGFGNSWQGAQ